VYSVHHLSDVIIRVFRQVGKRHGGQAAFVWVPGGNLAATLSADGQLQTWDLQNPAAPALLDTAILTAGEPAAACIAASADGTRLAVAAGKQISTVLFALQGQLSVLQQPVLQLQRSTDGIHSSMCRIAWHNERELLVCADGAAAVIVSI
jgi:3-hydroxyisobutyrate dehydrogenase-like beta-hydroxyacid dehydrogenase